MSEATYNQAATTFDEVQERVQERFLTGIGPMVEGKDLANGKRDDHRFDGPRAS